MKRLIGALIIVAIATIAGRLAYLQACELSWFRLTEVEINCPESLTDEQVLEMSLLKIGQSIFSQDIKLSGARLMRLPGVEAVEVKRLLPSKVSINVYPEEVVLFAKTDKIYGLTRGMKFIELGKMEEILPVVTGLSFSPYRDYQDKIKLSYALTIYARLCSLSENLAGRLSEIHFVDTNNVEMFFDPGGVKVIVPLRDYELALSRLIVLDTKGILGDTGAFDMTAGKMVVKSGV